MTNGEIMDIIVKQSMIFSLTAKKRMEANAHLCGYVDITQEQIDAVIVGLVNYLGWKILAMDLAMSADDLEAERDRAIRRALGMLLEGDASWAERGEK
jgi:hypothetical protein